MDDKEDLLENFKAAIISTVKTISNTDNVDVVFEGQNKSNDDIAITLPKIETINSKINFTKECPYKILTWVLKINKQIRESIAKLKIRLVAVEVLEAIIHIKVRVVCQAISSFSSSSRGLKYSTNHPQ